MFGLDFLSLLLVVGVVVLVISTTAMVMTMTPNARQRRRGPSHPLSPSAAHAVALARAAAAMHTAEVALGAPSAGQMPTGQIIDISDGHLTGRGAAREMTVEYAQALAEHVAETDPQFVAEVINQWIRADSSDPGVFR